MASNTAETLERSAEDGGFLWGAKAIGEYLGISERRAFYLLNKGLLPGRKVGKAYTTTRKALDELSPATGQ